MLAIGLLFTTFFISLNSFLNWGRLCRYFLDVATISIYLIKYVNFWGMIAETALAAFFGLNHILNKMKSLLFEFSIWAIHWIIKSINQCPTYLLILFVLKVNIFSVHRFWGGDISRSPPGLSRLLNIELFILWRFKLIQEFTLSWIVLNWVSCT